MKGIRLRNYFLIAVAICIAPLVHAQSTKVFYNILEYGATGKDTLVDTDAINKAIETAAAAGGGTIYFPPGNYYAFTIRLQSNI